MPIQISEAVSEKAVSATSSPLRYLKDWFVLVCVDCRQCVRKSQADRHLQGDDHALPLLWKCLLPGCSGGGGSGRDDGDNDDADPFLSRSDPFLSWSAKKMRLHGASVHRSRDAKGSKIRRPKAGMEEVSLQSFYHKKGHLRYFIVDPFATADNKREETGAAAAASGRRINAGNRRNYHP
jgi:hypothetical protein